MAYGGIDGHKKQHQRCLFGTAIMGRMHVIVSSIVVDGAVL
jgi:hypothetical protein